MFFEKVNKIIKVSKNFRTNDDDVGHLCKMADAPRV